MTNAETNLERVARAICIAKKRNPNSELIGGYEGPRRKQWEAFAHEAHAAIAVLTVTADTPPTEPAPVPSPYTPEDVEKALLPFQDKAD